MRLIIIFLFITSFTFAQSGRVSKIILTYANGGTSWDPGKYAITERLEYTALSNGDFQLAQFFTVTESLGNDMKTRLADTVNVNTRKYPKIDKQKIQDWMTQLNTHEDNHNICFVKPHLKKITDGEIKDVARSSNQDWYFDRDYKEERRELLKYVASFSELDSFLIHTSPSTELISVTTDYWNFLTVEVIGDSGTTVYLHDFENSPIGQPIEITPNKMQSTWIINLKANIAARVFLPQQSLAYEKLDLNNVKPGYIKKSLEKDF